WLQPGLAGRIDFMGSAIWGFLERGAANSGPVHRQRGGQMAAAQRVGVALAAWLRGAGTGTLQRAARAVSAPGRRGQSSGGLSDHTGAILSLLAATDAAV